MSNNNGAYYVLPEVQPITLPDRLEEARRVLLAARAFHEDQMAERQDWFEAAELEVRFELSLLRYRLAYLSGDERDTAAFERSTMEYLHNR